MGATPNDSKPSLPRDEALPSHAPWGELIPTEQWAVFIDGTDAISRAGVRFLLGGALALGAYTGHWRNTKDVDVIVHAEDRDRAVTALREASFTDYYEQQPYDRNWIFRGFRDGVIFDVIWQLPNDRVAVDEEFFQRSRSITLRGAAFSVIGPEDLIHIKLYVLQRDRCDWVDVLNVLAGSVGSIDWDWLVLRMGRDLPLLQSVLSIFNWMCPGRAHEIPAELRERFALPPITADDIAAMEQRRTRLIDSRPWFAMHQPADRPLEL